METSYGTTDIYGKDSIDICRLKNSDKIRVGVIKGLSKNFKAV